MTDLGTTSLHVMKNKIILSVVAACACFTTSYAQSGKIAIVDLQGIYRLMPESSQAEATLRVIDEQYRKEFKTVQSEFDKKYADYQALAAEEGTPSTIKQRRMQEILENDQKIQAFLKAAKADLKQRKESLEKPIKAKLNEAVKAVGQEGGYTYIIDNSTGNVVYSGSDAIDVTPLVKAKLGL